MKSASGVVALLVLAAGIANPQENGGKAPEVVRSAQLETLDVRRPIGWRGDGSGRFPDADPPVSWGRISETMKGLRTQATKPKGEGAGSARPIPYGTISDWLVLGPVRTEESIPDEAGILPDAGDRTADMEWKPIRVEGSLIHFNRLLPDAENLKGKAVYVHAYVYSPRARGVFLRKKDGTSAVRVNGELLGKETGRYTWRVQFKAGWNRILARSLGSRAKGEYDSTPEGTGYFQLELYGGEPDEQYEETGILWTVEPPQAGRPSCYQPVIVGNRVYVASSPAFLLCYDKLTGKRLWIRDSGFWEFITPEERARHPELFVQIDRKAKRFRELSESFAGDPGERTELGGLFDELLSLLQKVDPVKYASSVNGQEPGLASQPVSDGQFIYTLSYLGIAACYDLDGKLKWKTLENEGPQWKHGYMIAPMLVGKELVVEMKNIVGFDRETGKVQWKLPRRWQTYFHNGTREQGDQTDLVNYDGLGVYKPGLGFFPWSTTTRQGNKLYLSDCHSVLFMLFDLPERLTEAPTFKMREYGAWSMSGPILLPGVNWGTNQVLASPLFHNGLLYTVSTGGVLRVEEESLKHLYSRLLDLNPITWAYPYPHGSGVCASPTLGGKYVFLFGGNGATLVIKPGRTYEPAAKNRIERLLPGRNSASRYVAPQDPVIDRYPECTVSSPVFDGKRLYYRAERYLYCIGEAK